MEYEAIAKILGRVYGMDQQQVKEAIKKMDEARLIEKGRDHSVLSPAVPLSLLPESLLVGGIIDEKGLIDLLLIDFSLLGDRPLSGDELNKAFNS